MKLAAGCAPEPAQQVGLHPDLFCSANDLPALGVSDFESPFAYGTDDGFFTPNEKYSIHCCRMFHNVILLSLILGTTLRNINLAGVSSYCGVFYFTSIPVSRIGFILTGILADYLRQNKRSKVLAPGQCQGAAWRQVGLAETIKYQLAVASIVTEEPPILIASFVIPCKRGSRVPNKRFAEKPAETPANAAQIPASGCLPKLKNTSAPSGTRTT